MGTQLPSQSPNFRPMSVVRCGPTAGWIKMPLGMELGLGPGDFVLNGDPAPLPKMGHSPPIFGPCVLWPNICIRKPLGTEVGLDPRDIVLDGDPAPLPKKGQSAPIFGQCLLWPNGCMDQDATWCDGKASARATLC